VNGILDIDIYLYHRTLFETRIFHNGIAMLYVPVLILFCAYLYEKNKDKSILTRTSLVIVLMSFSHLLMDTFYPDTSIYLYYPFSMSEYQLDQSLIPLVILLFALAIIIVNLIETFLYRTNEGCESWSVRTEVEYQLKNYRRRLKRIYEIQRKI